MKIRKTIYHGNLIQPYGYRVVCGNQSKTFDRNERELVGEWVMSLWRDSFFPAPAEVYYQYGLGEESLYCQYELEEG